MNQKKRTIALVAARMTSTRLPGKIMKPILGKPALELMLERLKRVPGLDEIIIATTTNATDEPVVQLADKLGYRYFRGSELDVLGRIASAAQAFKADVVAEITSDCIVIDPMVVQQCLDTYAEGGSDYVSNAIVRTYPVGMDTQVFSTDLIVETTKLANTPDYREHVGLYIYMHPDQYKLRYVTAPPEATWNDLHLTLDTADVYSMLKALYEGLYPTKPNFDVVDIVKYLRAHPEIVRINEHIRRNKSQSEYFAELNKNK